LAGWHTSLVAFSEKLEKTERRTRTGTPARPPHGRSIKHTTIEREICGPDGTSQKKNSGWGEQNLRGEQADSDGGVATHKNSRPSGRSCNDAIAPKQWGDITKKGRREAGVDWGAQLTLLEGQLVGRCPGVAEKKDTQQGPGKSRNVKSSRQEFSAQTNLLKLSIPGCFEGCHEDGRSPQTRFGVRLGEKKGVRRRVKMFSHGQPSRAALEGAHGLADRRQLVSRRNIDL